MKVAFPEEVRAMVIGYFPTGLFSPVFFDVLLYKTLPGQQE